MPEHYLVLQKYVSRKQNTKIHPIGMATFKKDPKYIFLNQGKIFKEVHYLEVLYCGCVLYSGCIY